jgi:hypothetical protein
MMPRLMRQLYKYVELPNGTNIFASISTTEVRSLILANYLKSQKKYTYRWYLIDRIQRFVLTGRSPTACIPALVTIAVDSEIFQTSIVYDIQSRPWLIISLRSIDIFMPLPP